MNEIPNFPHFANLSLAHNKLMRRVTTKFPPYSDYSFISLYSWDTTETIGVSLLHDNIVVRFTDYHSNEIFLSLLGTAKLSDTLQALFDYCQAKHIVSELRLIPHSVISAFGAELEDVYDITEDHDNHDYIVSTENVSHGKIGRSKRKVAKYFQETYGENSVTKPLDLNDPDMVAIIKNLVEAWVSGRGGRADDKKELVAIDRCLHHATELGLRGTGTYVNNRLEAFILFDSLEKHTAILHFGKANRGYKGMFDHLKIEVAKQLYKEHVKYMNFEQDLGIEGLRNDKSQFRPVELLRKYVVSKKS